MSYAGTVTATMEPPTRTSALESLRRVLGEDAFDAWSTACEEAGVVSRPDLTPEEIATIQAHVDERWDLLTSLEGADGHA